MTQTYYPYRISEFYKNKYIPKLDPSVAYTKTEGPDNEILSLYVHKDHLVVNHFTIVNPDDIEGDYYKLFCICNKHLEILSTSALPFYKLSNFPVTLGSFLRVDFVASQIVDDLYYKFNHTPFKTKAGSLRKSIINALKFRLQSNRYSNAKFTIKLLHELEDDFNSHSDLVRIYSHNAWSYTAFQNWLEQVHRISVTHIHHCYFTKKHYPETAVKSSYFYGGWRTYSKEVNPEDFGYIRPAGEVNTYILEDEALYEGVIYKKDEIVLTACEDCGKDFVKHPDALVQVCSTCLNSSKYLVHSYNTKAPDLLKFKASKVKLNEKPLYFGIELEYECTYSNDEEEETDENDFEFDYSRYHVGKLLEDHAIMKHDGSIHSGFEIVTCPATIDIHLETFERFFNDFGSLKICGKPNTGMHVHVSRAPLNIFTIGKMTEFVNKPENATFLKEIAGRTPNTYCSMEPARTVTYPHKVGRYSERYNMLNLRPEHTVEFRMFNSPETFDIFAARLQFVQALVDYSKPCQHSLPLKEITKHESFINWLKLNRKQYNYLSNFLKGTI